MKTVSLTWLCLLAALSLTAQDFKDRITLVIHGGAGTITREHMTAEQEKAYREALRRSLQQGYAILEAGGTSLDAVTAAILVLEDSPLFNAGKGAVFTNEGKNELDASIMDGQSGSAGAVAGVTVVKNPIKAARAVMENSAHVLMTGKGAEKFAAEQGLEIVDPSYFYTETRFNSLRKAQEHEKEESDHPQKNQPPLKTLPKSGHRYDPPAAGEGTKFGTVGCVALDQYGNLAAGTSTGGMTNKRYGRIGDSPLIGAGTYADNHTCAVSATGHGEYFIRSVVAYDIAALMNYKNLSLKAAADEVIMKKLVLKGGEGGVIALDREGNIAMPFNTSGMYRGFVRKGGEPELFIFKE